MSLAVTVSARQHLMEWSFCSTAEADAAAAQGPDSEQR